MVIENESFENLVQSIFTVRKRSLGQGNMFTSVCHSFLLSTGDWGGLSACTGKGVGLIACTGRGLASQHALVRELA